MLQLEVPFRGGLFNPDGNHGCALRRGDQRRMRHTGISKMRRMKKQVKHVERSHQRARTQHAQFFD